jgi:hypothetical protein
VETRSGCVAPHDALRRCAAYGERIVRRSYAVVWENGARVDSGRLEPGFDSLRLVGRERLLAVSYAGLADVTIARRADERLRGLPVLVLRRHDGGEVRVASLEGAPVLRELLEHIVASGVAAA